MAEQSFVTIAAFEAVSSCLTEQEVASRATGPAPRLNRSSRKPKNVTVGIPLLSPQLNTGVRTRISGSLFGSTYELLQIDSALCRCWSDWLS